MHAPAPVCLLMLVTSAPQNVAYAAWNAFDEAVLLPSLISAAYPFIGQQVRAAGWADLRGVETPCPAAFCRSHRVLRCLT